MSIDATPPSLFSNTYLKQDGSRILSKISEILSYIWASVKFFLACFFEWVHPSEQPSQMVPVVVIPSSASPLNSANVKHLTKTTNQPLDPAQPMQELLQEEGEKRAVELNECIAFFQKLENNFRDETKSLLLNQLLESEQDLRNATIRDYDSVSSTLTTKLQNEREAIKTSLIKQKLHAVTEQNDRTLIETTSDETLALLTTKELKIRTLLKSLSQTNEQLSIHRKELENKTRALQELLKTSKDNQTILKKDKHTFAEKRRVKKEIRDLKQKLIILNETKIKTQQEIESLSVTDLIKQKLHAVTEQNERTLIETTSDETLALLKTKELKFRTLLESLNQTNEQLSIHYKELDNKTRALQKLLETSKDNNSFLKKAEHAFAERRVVKEIEDLNKKLLILNKTKIKTQQEIASLSVTELPSDADPSLTYRKKRKKHHQLERSTLSASSHKDL